MPALSVAMPPSAETQPAPLDATSQASIPFRQATTEQTGVMSGSTFTMTGASQRNINPVLSQGFLFGLWINYVATAASNTAMVGYTEDGLFGAAFSQIILSDTNGQLINTTGFETLICNLVDKLYQVRYLDALNNPLSLWGGIAGNGATAGSFATSLRVPVGLDRRTLTSIISNQDRNQIYNLRADIAGSGDVYSTVPTTLPGIAVNYEIESYTVPLPVSADGVPQGVVPSNYGTLHQVVAANAQAVPVGGSTIAHQLPEIGNTIRWIAFVMRSNGSRALAEANAPTQLQMQIGSQAIYTENYSYRRALMYERFGFVLPPGVLVYDLIHDFGVGAGAEIGNDYWHTAKVVRAQLSATYPSGFGSTNNSIDVITDVLTPAVIAA